MKKKLPPQKPTRKKFKLPPDPEDMNDKRAQWAGACVQEIMRQTGCDHDTAVGDLIADLFHYCDRHGLDRRRELTMGLYHYAEETNTKRPFGLEWDVFPIESWYGSQLF